ncbi:MAG: rhodanese-related sulfurtransferase [Rickettsiales bacterium]|nr:rhodanese-related sulfurtransferase [Rickettsiales bacterium]
MAFIVAAFYHFFDFPDYKHHRESLLALLKREDIKGSILIASEGFNGTISGSRSGIDTVLAFLTILGGTFEHKESTHTSQPFGRAKVRLKKELISLGPYVTPREVGTYVTPQEWNALIDDPNTVVLDTRNSYETHLGTFSGAIDPNIRNFKQLPQYVASEMQDLKDKKIATFCTGGIRCEKFTAWMKEQGFKDVYHLKGGILKYLEEIPPEDSRWQGECYVFDNRVAVGHGLHPSQTASICQNCGHALTPEDRTHPEYGEKHCQYCATYKLSA